MAESIVSCPECGKKFRIRDASTPGRFECSACQAEVSYGAPAAARPARAKPARGKAARGRGGARGGGRGGPRGGGRGEPRGGGRGEPGRARGGARGGARGRRGGRYGDEEGGPPPKSNAALYAILGVGGAVVVIGVVIAIVLSSGSDPVTPVAGGGGGLMESSGGGGVSALNQPGETPMDAGVPEARRPTPEDEPATPRATGGIGEVNQPDPVKPAPGESETTREATPPDRSIEDAGVSEGGFYGKKRTNLRSLSYDRLAKELDHFDDTPADLRAEIDKLCATIVDFDAGRDGNVARDRLREIGRAALPKVISAFLKTGDPGEQKGMINSCVVDGTLRGIAGSPRRVYPKLTQMAHHSKEHIRKAAKSWFVWWYSEGYAIKSFETEEPGEEEEE